MLYNIEFFINKRAESNLIGTLGSNPVGNIPVFRKDIWWLHRDFKTTDCRWRSSERNEQIRSKPNPNRWGAGRHKIKLNLNRKSHVTWYHVRFDWFLITRVNCFNQWEQGKAVGRAIFLALANGHMFSLVYPIRGLNSLCYACRNNIYTVINELLVGKQYW